VQDLKHETEACDVGEGLDREVDETRHGQATPSIGPVVRTSPRLGVLYSIGARLLREFGSPSLAERCENISG
jgi:hypothetical protein